MKQMLILDCDPGQDDALAILLALGSADELDLLGITTVAGNVPLELTQSNARKMCELAGVRVSLPLARCQQRPAAASQPTGRHRVTDQREHRLLPYEGRRLRDGRRLSFQ